MLRSCGEEFYTTSGVDPPRFFEKLALKSFKALIKNKLKHKKKLGYIILHGNLKYPLPFCVISSIINPTCCFGQHQHMICLERAEGIISQ